MIDDADGNSLRFTRRVTQPITDRILPTRQNLCRSVVSLCQACRLAVDRTTRSVFNTVIEKPRLAQCTRSFGFDDVVVLDRQLNVVADATAESARRIMDNLQFARNGWRGGMSLSGTAGHSKKYFRIERY